MTKNINADIHEEQIHRGHYKSEFKSRMSLKMCVQHAVKYSIYKLTSSLGTLEVLEESFIITTFINMNIF